METFITIFLIPYTVFKYAFCIAIWYYGIGFLLNSERWEDMARNLKDLWR